MRLGVLVGVLIASGSGGVAESSASFLVQPDSIAQTVQDLFLDMPPLKYVGGMTGQCGADDGVNDQVAYCATRNELLYRMDSYYAPWEPYELAHVYGHVIQIRHGVADVALREIRSRPEEEDKLRGWVTRQVECIAGFIMSKAGLPAFNMADFYEVEPMTGSHWGRDPLSVGPKVSIGMEERQEWLTIGEQADLSACAVGEFGSELLVAALR